MPEYEPTMPIGSRSMRKTARSIAIVASIASLAALNVVTLIDDGVHELGYKAIGKILQSVMPEATVSRILSSSPTAKSDARRRDIEQRHLAESARRSAAVKKVSTRAVRRATLNAVKNAGGVVAEAVPVAGIAVVLGLTASDLYDDCQTIKDMNELNAEFEIAPEDDRRVCGMSVPTKDEVIDKVRRTVSPREIWRNVRDLFN